MERLGQPAVLVGRRRECALIGAIHGRAAADGVALLRCGEPGAGKTMLLDATAEQSADGRYPMSLPAPDSAELGFQVGDHVCAFYDGGNSLDDIVVDYLSKGLQAGDKCVCFIDTASSVRARVPADLITRDDSLQFFTEDEAYLPGGRFSKDALLGGLEALAIEAVSGGYDRLWVLGNVSWIARSTVDIKTWFAAESGVNDLAARRPQFIMCLYDLRLFDGEAVMYVLQTHPRIFVSGIIITNPHYIPRRQFLSSV